MKEMEKEVNKKSKNRTPRVHETFRFWAISPEEVISSLETSQQGLSSDEAKKRLKKYGENSISNKEGKHALEILFSQFKNALVLILIIALVISYFLGEKIDSIVIFSIVIINSILGFFQEYKAERVARELKKYVPVKSKVLRNGKFFEIDSKELVPGDVVQFVVGDIVPADLRLINVDGLTANESVLTGESIPVMKKISVISERYSLPSELSNMIFMGTSIASGNCKGIVVATGENTFFGRTAEMINENFEGDFQKSIRKFSNFLLKVILVMTAFIFLTNAILGRGIITSLLFAVALAIGITPEVLPVVITISLSRGALRMAKQKVIIKKLASVEDLGNIDILCSDKTGTLTEGVLSLKSSLNIEGTRNDTVLLYGMICNSVKEGEDISGDLIDRAIWRSEEAQRLRSLVKNYEIIGKNDFDFTRRRMSVVVKTSHGNLMITKGAPESILKVCSSVRLKNNRRDLSTELLKEIEERIKRYEQQGYRVIAVGEKSISKSVIVKNDERGLSLIGLLLFLDPAKKTVKESLALLQKMNVSIKIMSGDSPIITRKICNDVGLVIIDDRVITGDEIEKMNDKQLEDCCMKYNIFSRVTPEQKAKLVSKLKGEGHIVGFLGDGVNDVPALKIADVGISVEDGTGIAKESADIILLQKSLRVIAYGILEGRKTFGNITKYTMNTVSANYGNMFTVASSSLYLKFIPMLPSQILLTNFMTDVPQLTVSTDNVDEELLKKPKHWDIKLISRFMLYFGLLSSIFDLLLIIPLIYFMKIPLEEFRTAWFVESVLSEIIIMFSLRTKKIFIKSRPSSALVVSSLIAAIISVGIIYTAFGNKLFEFVALQTGILLFIAAILILYFISSEIMKRYFFKKFEI